MWDDSLFSTHDDRQKQSLERTIGNERDDNSLTRCRANLMQCFDEMPQVHQFTRVHHLPIGLRLRSNPTQQGRRFDVIH